MQLPQLVNMFGADLQRRYGEKIHKLSLHGRFSCPNRDGTLGPGGCTFCNVASFADERMQRRSIGEQLALLAPLWCENRWSGMQAVGGYLRHHGGQGSALEEKLRYRP